MERPTSSTYEVTDDSTSSWNLDNSKVIAAIGVDALKRLQAARVLVMGMSGVGVEIAKNLGLMGAGHITILDDELFCLSPEHVGKPRGASVLQRLQGLAASVDLKTGELSADTIAQYNAVACTSRVLAEVTRVADSCRARGIPFVTAQTFGLYGFLFNDFGKQFEVVDITGLPAHTGFAEIRKTDPLECSSSHNIWHQLEEGAIIRFIDATPALTRLIGRDFVVSVVDRNNFKITAKGLEINWSGATVGQWVEVKQPVTLSFKSWSESIATVPSSGEAHIFGGRMSIADAFCATRALYEFNARYHRTPRPTSLADAEALAAIAAQLNLSPYSTECIKQVAIQAAGNLAPMAALFGGFAAQEILKACGKCLLPIRQFCFFDALEALPDLPLTEKDVTPMNSRYDGQIAVFGRELCEEIHRQRYLLMGCGGLGCEVAKNWAMMGLGTAPKAAILIADTGVVKRSDLSRTMLYRSTNIGQLKANVAIRALAQLNPEMCVGAVSDNLIPALHSIPEPYWDNYDGACGLTRHEKPRGFLSTRCSVFRKPLFIMTSKGSCGETYVVVPDKTETYTELPANPEFSLKYHGFPFRMEHVLMWARSELYNAFDEAPDTCLKYATDPQYLPNQPPHTRISRLRSIISMVTLAHTLDDCITWARHLFDELFDHAIQKLMASFPIGQTDSSGILFWSLPRRAPRVTKFDPNNSLHVSFVNVAAYLRAYVLGMLPEKLKPQDLRPRATHVRAVAAAVESRKCVIPKPITNKDDNAVDDNVEIAELESQLPAREQLQHRTYLPITLQEENLELMTLEFVYLASCIKAMQYQVACWDRFQSMIYVTSLTAALASANASVAALSCMEFFKVVQRKQRARIQTEGIARPSFVSEAPPSPAPVVYANGTATKWDRWELYLRPTPDLTLAKLFEEVKKICPVEIDLVAVGSSGLLIYAVWNRPMAAAQLSMPFITLLLNKRVPDPTGQHPLILYISGMLPDGADTEVPDLHVWWGPQRL